MLCNVHRIFLTWCSPPPDMFALSRWASHPAVSAFALSWKQHCDRSWVGVRDELWGNGQVFTAEAEMRVGGRQRREVCLRGLRQGCLMESWEGSDMEAEEQRVFTPSLLRGMLSLSCLADLKSAIPSISARRRSGLVNSSLHRIFNWLYSCFQTCNELWTFSWNFVVGVYVKTWMSVAVYIFQTLSAIMLHTFPL